jgi:hypothetical protein
MPAEQFNAMPPDTHTFPHQQEWVQAGGELTADHVAVDLQQNPVMYHPGLDPHLEANGISVRRPTENDPVLALETAAAEAAEQSPGHDWQSLAELPRTAAHTEEHDKIGQTLDSDYLSRSPSEKAAISISGELGELAEKDSLRGASLSNELLDIPEQLQPRIEAAVEASEFESTPEVRQAIAGYYTDHYKLAAVIEHVIDNDITPEDVAAVTAERQGETFTVNQAIQELVTQNADPSNRQETIRQVDRLLRNVLFAETAIGTMTQGEAEEAVASRLVEKLAQQAVTEGFADTHDGRALWRRPMRGRVMNGKEIVQGMQYRKEKVVEDMRHAGQLLFHNSGNFQAIAQSGYRLMSRTKQLEETGTFHVQTQVDQSLGGNMHSNLPHWSEGFDPLGYKLPSRDTRMTPGTLAMPLAEIIKTAPYARNAQYATVRLKHDHTELADTIPINDTTIDLGPGAPDSQGKYGWDRVFVSDYRADHATEAVSYAFDAGSGTASEYGNKAYQVFTSGEERVYYDGSDTYGIGENSPGKVVLDFDYVAADPQSTGRLHTQESLDAKMKRMDTMKRALAEQIHKLQLESRERPDFAGQYVVPLRQGVVEFDHEGNHVDDAFGRYRQQVTHSAVSAEAARAVRERTGRM